jgi:hypothetical protein
MAGNLSQQRPNFVHGDDSHHEINMGVGTSKNVRNSIKSTLDYCFPSRIVLSTSNDGLGVVIVAASTVPRCTPPLPRRYVPRNDEMIGKFMI